MRYSLHIHTLMPTDLKQSPWRFSFTFTLLTLMLILYFGHFRCYLSPLIGGKLLHFVTVWTGKYTSRLVLIGWLLMGYIFSPCLQRLIFFLLINILLTECVMMKWIFWQQSLQGFVLYFGVTSCPENVSL